VHRIGRTARAGAAGVAISLCDGEESAFLRDIEKLIRISIPTTDHRSFRQSRPAVSMQAPRAPAGASGKHRQQRRSRPDKQDRRQQPGSVSGGIGAVAFLQRATRASTDGARRAHHGNSKG
jgi:ATP-dependent RNA helicase RhlE